MRWINQCMFHIKWLHFIFVKRSILLQSLSKSGLKHIFIASNMFWISKSIERINVFYLQLVQIGHGHWWSVPWFNCRIWWISEMVILIEQIRRFKKTLFLWLIKFIFKCILNILLVLFYSMKSAFSKPICVSICKTIWLLIITKHFISVSFFL